MSEIRFVLLGLLLIVPAAFGQGDITEEMAGLSGESSYNPGEVLLRWTAPGDNGYTGQASGYDIRYQSYYAGPLDTEAEWRNAVKLLGEPHPSLAGLRDSMIVTGLVYGASFYFAMKAYDAGGNYSVLSNSPLLTAGDTLNCPYIPGDANADGYVNIKDVAYVISFLYKEGGVPYPMTAADADGSGVINILDVSYVILAVYHEGPNPFCH